MEIELYEHVSRQAPPASNFHLQDGEGQIAPKFRCFTPLYKLIIMFGLNFEKHVLGWHIWTGWQKVWAAKKVSPRMALIFEAIAGCIDLNPVFCFSPFSNNIWNV